MKGLLKSRLNAWRYERKDLELAIHPLWRRLGLRSWVDLTNRNEGLLPGSAPDARVCDAVDSSFLSVARLFPRTGARLMRYVLGLTRPILADVETLRVEEDPEVSVILPVAGVDRLELLQVVLRSFAGQMGVCLEVIVVEHAPVPATQAHLPESVRYLQVPRVEGEGFNKSKAMNAAVRLARAPVVLLHDADVVVPSDYVRGVAQRLNEGWEGIKPMRYVFFLDEKNLPLVQQERFEEINEIEWVQQHNPGISTACRTDVYWAIGGHDERFEGWGGEDNEFLDRLKMRRFFKGGYTWGLHLWHPPAPKKQSGHRNAELAAQIRSVAPEARIERLKKYCYDA